MEIGLFNRGALRAMNRAGFDILRKISHKIAIHKNTPQYLLRRL